jgi:radical SAM superfamily enzyme YgiQ (UPF0313 family)
MFFLFVQPCKDFPAIQGFQLGLLSIIANLRAQGHTAEYLTLWSEDQYKYEYLNPEIDVIGIYTIECMIPEIKKFIENHKGKHHILLGGPTATIAPEYCSQQLYYDSLCVGEGELAIQEFATKFKTPEFKHMKGFWFDSGGIRNELRQRLSQDELIALNHPIRTEYLPIIENAYTNWSQRVTSIYATRGCVFNCAYCSNSAYNKLIGSSFRMRTPEQILIELEEVKGKLTTVTFEDDILTFNKEWFGKLMKLFKERFYTSRGTRFEMNTRVGCITKEQIVEAADAGCLTIRFGVESGSKEIREVMGRPNIENKDLLNLAQDVLDAGMNIYYCSIIGVPPETSVLFDQTRSLVDQIYKKVPSNRKAVVILNSFYPLHGTPLGDYCYKNNWVQNPVYGIGAHTDYSLVTPYMTREFVLQQQQEFRKNYTGMIPMMKELCLW